MFEKLENKVVVITGSNGLIGKEVVNQLKRSKAHVVGLDLENNSGDSFHFIACDITDKEEIDRAIDTIVKEYSRIDGLVNLAYPRTADWGNGFENVPLDSWQRNVDMQLNSVFYICQKVLKIMKEQRSGSIVNIGSIYGVVGNDFTMYDGDKGTAAAYTAIKGGIINLTRYLASFYGQFNVRINCVSPGGVLDESKQNPAFIKKYSERSPMKRMGNPEEMASPIVYLLSDGATYITGHNLMVDGGWTAI